MTVFMSRFRTDVRLTSYIERYWISRSEEIKRLVRWTFAASSSGILRVYPGIELNVDGVDPTQ
jgi:hypothetical protein